MADEFWTLNFYMKDAPSGEFFLEERMDKDLICYFDIIGLIEKQGYTSMDYLYCKRNGHGRRRSEMVEIISDLDVSRMVCEHEVDHKLSFYVIKQTDCLNIGIRRSEQVRIGESAEAERRQALPVEQVNGSGYNTEASHETDHEAERAERQAGLEAMKRRRADPNVNWKMHKKHRQQRDLRLDLEDEDSEEEDEENLLDSHEHTQNEEEDSQDPLEHDTTLLSASQEPVGSVKIVWPNGVIREFRGRFQASNLLKMKSGKVIVQTDQNGIPNQRSSGVLSSFIGGLAKNSSYAPLHVARWDNKLLETPKRDLIDYVETKFVYPEPTKENTEAWILRIVNKRWRDYKSFLKNKYYNPSERSLERIKKQIPPGVNRHQWTALLGIWCQEQHLRTCHRNSESAKQQRHPHTTGRKSHARLKKEMEDKSGGPINKIDLWDEAHKRKDGKYTNEDVHDLMHKARKELAARKKMKKGILSSKDYDQVFDDVIAKESTIGGYYSDKYWDNAKLLQGSTSVGQSSTDVRVQNELQAVKRDLKNVTELAKRLLAFLEQKYPTEDWMSEMLVNQNEVNTSVDVGDGATPNELGNVEESMENVKTSENDPKEAQFAHHIASK